MRIRPLVIAGALLLSCTALTSTAVIGHADSNARPLTGSFASVSPCSTPCFSFAGQLSHLGSFTGQITGFSLPGGTSPSCPVVPPPTPGVEAGCTTATWTAANGDTVTDYTIFYITGFDAGTGMFTFSQAIQITGGTGRFAGATGSATATGETTGTFSQYYGTINGTIGY